MFFGFFQQAVVDAIIFVEILKLFEVVDILMVALQCVAFAVLVNEVENF